MDAFSSPSEIQAELGKRLKRLRIRHGLTQSDLASQANLSRQAIVDLENSGTSSVRTLVSVLHALGETGSLNLIAPEQGFSPIAAMRGMREPQRVRNAPP